MEEYKSISSIVYNFTKPVGTSIDGDLEYYFNLLRDVDGPILEAGVGTGRLLIPYAKRGLPIDGVDLSEDMLTICENNCIRAGIEVDLYHQNLIKLDIDKKYEAIIMPTGSFCLITNKREMFKMLRSFRNHLTETGELIIDLIYPIDFQTGETTKLLELDNNLNIVYSSNNIKMDMLKQETHTINRYEKWIDGKLVDTEISKFNMKWYGIDEFVYILEEAGFTNIAYGYGYGNDIPYVVTFRAERD